MRRTILSGFVLAAIIAGVAEHVPGVLATPAVGFTSTTLALGRFGDIDVLNRSFPSAVGTAHKRDFWISWQKTKGDSDLYVQSNVWAPGGSTGWHTHPGHSLITVTAGAVTVYEGDDTDCTPHVYTQGMGVVDEGGDHVHIIRNEGTIEARTITVQLIPAGAARRIDAPVGPASCPF